MDNSAFYDQFAIAQVGRAARVGGAPRMGGAARVPGRGPLSAERSLSAQSRSIQEETDSWLRMVSW